MMTPSLCPYEELSPETDVNFLCRERCTMRHACPFGYRNIVDELDYYGELDDDYSDEDDFVDDYD